MSGMRIGLDFDNTIVCYDEVFYEEALRHGLILSSTPVAKERIKEALIEAGKEERWTELQGHVYGKCMNRARVYPGFFDFLSCARRKGTACSIISHKTRIPYRGPAYDLHQSARKWLHANGFFDAWGFTESDVHFLESKQLKLRYIAEAGCAYFVDDLPEFLSEKKFPPRTTPILFAPNAEQACLRSKEIAAFQTWNEIRAYIFGE